MFWKEARRTYGHLTADDEDVRKFTEFSHQVQHDGYKGIVGWIQDRGHRWIARRTMPGPVLEIGFGTGRHRLFFKGNIEEYFVSEYSEIMLGSDAWNGVKGVCCDARQLPYKENVFQTAISIYNLEHIKDLQHVFHEVHHILKPRGVFLIALPCEGGLLWNVGREFTTRPYFQKKYGMNYDKAIAYEHVHDLTEILCELKQSGLFSIEETSLLPFLIPTHHLNLILCMKCFAIK